MKCLNMAPEAKIFKFLSIQKLTNQFFTLTWACTIKRFTSVINVVLLSTCVLLPANIYGQGIELTLRARTLAYCKLVC
jgi:hypothetical protein